MQKNKDFIEFRFSRYNPLLSRTSPVSTIIPKQAFTKSYKNHPSPLRQFLALEPSNFTSDGVMNRLKYVKLKMESYDFKCSRGR
jgi:hypothetical protein